MRVERIRSVSQILGQERMDSRLGFCERRRWRMGRGREGMWFSESWGGRDRYRKRRGVKRVRVEIIGDIDKFLGVDLVSRGVRRVARCEFEVYGPRRLAWES
jgi:hypothetical protein